MSLFLSGKVIEPQKTRAILSGGTNPWAGVLTYENKLVCATNFSEMDARVACRDAGYGPPREIDVSGRNGLFRSHISSFAKTNPRCSGDESRLADCTQTKLGEECRNYVSLFCRRTEVDRQTKEIWFDGKQVSSTGFSENEATAVCRDNGYKTGLPVQLSKSISGVRLSCSTSKMLEDCDVSDEDEDKQAAGVQCSEPQEVQLAQSDKPGMGTVLFRKGAVCDDGWNMEVKRIYVTMSRNEQQLIVLGRCHLN